jgi:hypothetical protein
MTCAVPVAPLPILNKTLACAPQPTPRRPMIWTVLLREAITHRTSVISPWMGSNTNAVTAAVVGPSSLYFVHADAG